MFYKLPIHEDQIGLQEVAFLHDMQIVPNYTQHLHLGFTIQILVVLALFSPVEHSYPPIVFLQLWLNCQYLLNRL